MKKKNVLIVILTTLIFLSGVLLGVANVYRINAVCVSAPLISDEAKAEVDELQTRLQAAYHNESIFFAEEAIAEEIVADFPYFRITEFKKSYPNRIVVEVSEDAEVYAVACGGETDGYYILNAEGTVLGIREDYKNRVDSNDNLLITGITATGEKGKPLAGDDILSVLFSTCGEMSNALSGIRRNVMGIEVFRPTSDASETTLIFSMREGVKLYIFNPAAQTAEKARKAIDEYLGLSSEKRLTGMVVVSDGVNGLVAQYFQDEWQIS